MNKILELKKVLSITKLLLFISAYSPLLLIIAIKTYSYKITIPLDKVPYEIPIISIGLIVLFIIFIFISFHLINRSKSNTRKYIIVNNVDEKTDIILSYLIPYIISFISLGTPEEIISAIVIFTFVFLIYSNSEIIYINPIFMLFGYKFYHLYTEKNYVILLSKQDMYRSIGEKIEVKQLSSRLYIVEGEKNA